MHIRKIARSVIVAGLALAMTVTTAFASLGTATVTASPSLRLRSAASTNSTTLRTVPKGASVEVLSEKENGWYKVSYNGIVGYMSADWLKVSPSTGSNTSTSGGSSSSAQTGTVTYALNVRRGPGTSYSRVATLPKGTTVTILSSSNGWYSIKAGSVTGYVSAQYVSVSTSSGGSSSNNNSSSSSSGNSSSGSSSSTTPKSGKTTTALNVRSGPGTSYSRVATLSKGTTVTIISTSNGWHKIAAGSVTGYVSAQYVSVSNSSGSGSSGNNSSSSSSGNSSSGSSSSTTLKSGKTTTALNVRSGPGTSYSRVSTLSKGATVTILSTSNGWHQIASGSVTGYVSADYVTVDASSSATLGAYVNAGPLNVRSGPGTSYSKVGSVKERTKVTILESNGGWYKIESGSLTGYVSAEYITLGNPPSNSSSSNNSSSNNSSSNSSSSGSNAPASSVGEQAAAMAKSLLGCPYVYGAAGPRSFDCSGLSYYIYGQLGYKLSRGSSGQYNNNGTFVSLENAQPGDLVFFFDPRFDGSGGTLPTTHMGICVGDGKFIHASTTSYTVQYDNLFNSYYTKYIVGVKRIA